MSAMVHREVWESALIFTRERLYIWDDNETEYNNHYCEWRGNLTFTETICRHAACPEPGSGDMLGVGEPFQPLLNHDLTSGQKEQYRQTFSLMLITRKFQSLIHLITRNKQLAEGHGACITQLSQIPKLALLDPCLPGTRS